jgi:uncharacterized protein (DUF983 family)
MSQSPIATGLLRGFALHCPNCGKGPVLHKYLKVTSPCPVCGHNNAQYPSDDAPPYFTILLVGHLIIAPLLLMPFVWLWPAWAVLALTLPVVSGLTLLLLPRVKGAIIGVQWGIHQREGVVPGRETPELP